MSTRCPRNTLKTGTEYLTFNQVIRMKMLHNILYLFLGENI